MSHGGKRQGAGRPKGKNKYGELTKPIRIPLSLLEKVSTLLENKQNIDIPLFSNKVSAGFPSPADDYVECKLDLNSYLIQHPAATFFVRASGDSMENAGIHSGDLLIVDKSIEATHGKVVIAALDGELTVKRLFCQHGRIQLMPENPNYPPIDITETQDIVIWGVVTHVIHEPK